MFAKELKEYVLSNQIDDILSKIICSNELDEEKQRYIRLIDKAVEIYGDGDYHFISSPGRTEVGGNHTDHQHGHVLAASLNIDNLCIVKKNDENICRYIDASFHTKDISLNDLSVKEEERNTTESLIRGIANKVKLEGLQVGGFDCLCDSKVLVGSGISSSACFEVMVAEIFNYLYNDGKINDVDRAIYGQYAEREYFGKPCGLLDQMTISVGGFVAIDFKEQNKPVIENYEFSFDDYGYQLLLVNTKGDHADLSHEYAAVPNEIKEVAHELGVEVLADSSYEELLKNIKDIREKTHNDRGILRSIHFFREDKRAVEEKNAVVEKDIKKLLNYIKGSGHSSFMYLQNVYPASRPESQSLALALGITAEFIGDNGAYRVHGGGFDGTIQVILPKERIDEYKALIEPIYGDDAILFVKVRPFGTKTII